MDIDVRVMGQRIRAARKQKSMTIEQLAEQIGIAAESLGYIECGARKPSLQTLYHFADTLNVSLDFLTNRVCSPTQTLLQNAVDEVNLNASQKKLLIDLAMSMLPVINEIP